jgi:hypothetical protein
MKESRALNAHPIDTLREKASGNIGKGSETIGNGELDE